MRPHRFMHPSVTYLDPRDQADLREEDPVGEMPGPPPVDPSPPVPAPDPGPSIDPEPQPIPDEPPELPAEPDPIPDPVISG